jgi:hypothetical protein
MSGQMQSYIQDVNSVLSKILNIWLLSDSHFLVVVIYNKVHDASQEEFLMLLSVTICFYINI